MYAGLDASGQPKYEAPKRPITMRDILRHTAGFQRRWTPDGRRGYLPASSIRATSTTRCPKSSAKFAQVPLAYQPGTHWMYSDAVDVQAYLVQKISGVPFDKFLELHIFRPLGMTSRRATPFCPPMRIARSSRRCTRAMMTAASRARRTRRPTGSTARPGR